MIAEREDARRARVTFASAPKPARKSDSAMGVTYSCEKRTSVRAKNASPGFTAATPTLPERASTMACAREDLLAERHRARRPS